MLAYDEATGTTGIYTVTAVWVHEDPVLVQLTLDTLRFADDLEQIATTPEHPFFTEERGWVAAGELQRGEHVRRADGSYGVVHAVVVEHRSQTMYNLSVATAHTFFVGDGRWLVHNDGCRTIINRPFAKSSELNRLVIQEMYRGKWVNGQWVSADNYPGGLAGAIRRELATGELVGGKSHLPKGQHRLKQLKRILKEGRVGQDILNEADLHIVRELHDDLLRALQGN